MRQYISVNKFAFICFFFCANTKYIFQVLLYTFRIFSACIFFTFMFFFFMKSHVSECYVDFEWDCCIFLSDVMIHKSQQRNAATYRLKCPLSFCWPALTRRVNKQTKQAASGGSKLSIRSTRPAGAECPAAVSPSCRGAGAPSIVAAQPPAARWDHCWSLAESHRRAAEVQCSKIDRTCRQDDAVLGRPPHLILQMKEVTKKQQQKTRQSWDRNQHTAKKNLKAKLTLF